MEKVLETITNVEREIQQQHVELEPSRQRALEKVRQEVREFSRTKQKELDVYQERLTQDALSRSHSQYQTINEGKQDAMNRLKKQATAHFDEVKNQLIKEILNHGNR
ncbi:MAG: hypothetical protein GX778_00410 [Erysipelothrix sp.]|nr:hypothetical protein [Erysipelothrix sp.]